MCSGYSPPNFDQKRVVGVDAEMRSRMAGQGQLRAEPGVHEVAADQIADRIVGQRRMEEVADLQADDHHAHREGQLEERVCARFARDWKCRGHVRPLLR
jgi:hypothetical protein